MPIYEYVCAACGEATEVMQRMADAPATTCPACHAEKLVKQVSAAGFRLKGAGWYETDFKSDKKRNLSADSDAPPVTKDAEPSKDAKPAADAKPAKTEEGAKPAAKDSAPAKPAAAPAVPPPGKSSSTS